MTSSKRQIQKSDAIARLWQLGELRYKLYEPQIEIRDCILNAKSKKVVIKCSRRLGKSYALMCYAIERAVKNQNARIPFAAPTYKDLKNILIPIVRDIIKDCPTAYRPIFKAQDNSFYFPSSNSEIQLAGVNNKNAEALRGKEALDCIVDEAGFVDELRYLVDDILMPQLMFSRSGHLVMSSTPPISPAHDFVSYIAAAESEGNLVSKEIFDNPRLSQRDILEIAKEAGCVIVDGEIVEESTTWLREYRAKVITDMTHAVIPEFTDAKAKVIVREWERPELFHPYVFMDTGYIDFTAVLFLYYDFRKAKIIVEDELVIDVRREDRNSAYIAQKIKEKEHELWGDLKVYQRFADGDNLLLADFGSIHGLHFAPVSKDVLEAQVNSLRYEIQTEGVYINPRCTQTIIHTKYAVFDKQRKKLLRAERMGHFDCLMALIYAVRHINKAANPYPKNWKVDSFSQFVKVDEDNRTNREIKKLFQLQG